MAVALPKPKILERIGAVVEAIVVLFFIGLAIYLVMYTTVSPIVAGLLLILTISLLVVGNVLMERGILKKEWKIYYYLLIVGIVLLVYGFTAKYLPITSSALLGEAGKLIVIYQFAMSTIIAFVIILIALAVFSLYYYFFYYRKGKPLFTLPKVR